MKRQSIYNHNCERLLADCLFMVLPEKAEDCPNLSEPSAHDHDVSLCQKNSQNRSCRTLHKDSTFIELKSYKNILESLGTTAHFLERHMQTDPPNTVPMHDPIVNLAPRTRCSSLVGPIRPCFGSCLSKLDNGCFQPSHSCSSHQLLEGQPHTHLDSTVKMTPT